MPDRHEREHFSEPHQILESMVAAEPLGSPVFQAISDHFAMLSATAEVSLLRANPTSVEMQKAVATWAQIRETQRQRAIGESALHYIRVDLDPVHKAYWEANKVPASNMEGLYKGPETHLKMSRHALQDLRQIISDRVIHA